MLLFARCVSISHTKLPFGMIVADLKSRGCRKLKRGREYSRRPFLVPATRT